MQRTDFELKNFDWTAKVIIAGIAETGIICHGFTPLDAQTIQLVSSVDCSSTVLSLLIQLKLHYTSKEEPLIFEFTPEEAYKQNCLFN